MQTDNENIQGLDDMQKRIAAAKEFIKKMVPDLVGTEAVKHYKQNFVDESFDGKKWASRKTKREGGTNGQRVLSKSGELGDSLTYRKKPGIVVITSDKPYAEIHNEGGTIEVTDKMRSYFWAKHYEAAKTSKEMADQWKWLALAKEIKMPKRQFVGDSDKLIKKLVDKIAKHLERILTA